MKNKVIKNNNNNKNNKNNKKVIKITEYYYNNFTRNLLLNLLLKEIKIYDESEPAYIACNEIIKQLSEVTK